jgi:hypothetical protein
MRRDANGARDFFAPMEIGEEVLTESLASHRCNSVAGGAGTLRLRSGQAGWSKLWSTSGAQGYETNGYAELWIS